MSRFLIQRQSDVRFLIQRPELLLLTRGLFSSSQTCCAWPAFFSQFAYSFLTKRNQAQSQNALKPFDATATGAFTTVSYLQNFASAVQTQHDGARSPLDRHPVKGGVD